METMTDFIFLGSKITADGACTHEIKTCSLSGRKTMTKLDGLLKRRDIADKVPSSQSYGFSSSNVWMWELDYKESWVPKNWYFCIVVLEKTLDCPLDCKEGRAGPFPSCSAGKGLESGDLGGAAAAARSSV